MPTLAKLALRERAHQQSTGLQVSVLHEYQQLCKARGKGSNALSLLYVSKEVSAGFCCVLHGWVYPYHSGSGERRVEPATSSHSKMLLHVTHCSPSNTVRFRNLHTEVTLL